MQPAESDLEALERFVVENDDLLTLEERIGRFNIFDALGIVRKEVRHSNFLAWLLSPSESHGHGDVYLRAFLMDLFKHARHEGFAVPISPVELDGGDLDDFEIKREWNRIDLLMLDENRRFLVAIENKVDSGEHSDQLTRYEEVIARDFPDWGALHVFLTPTGEDPEDNDWVPYSYRRLHHVIARVKRISGGAAGSDVSTFVDHYLNLLETQLMDDERIAELCKRIYANHQRAIDLVWEHAGTDNSEVLAEVERVVQSRSDRWVFYKTNRRVVRFMFKPLMDVVPLVGKPGATWLHLNFNLYRPDSLKYRVGATLTEDRARRERVVRRLTQTREEFGMRVGSRSWAKRNWISLGQGKLLALDPEQPDLDKIPAAINKQLDIWEKRWASLPDVIREIEALPLKG